MSEQQFGSFEEFWPHYVRAHTNPTNRRLHFVGTSLAMACVASAALFRRPLLLLAAPVVGYGFAWVGHFGFEKNTPATFGNPLYSLRADFVMWSKMVNGTMDAEVERYATPEPTVTPPHAEPKDANGVHADVTVTAN
ncbi:MAG TPA: DUF962 domain-containing protein [Polyangiaceae bacterium]|jgi:hypothetical protein